MDRGGGLGGSVCPVVSVFAPIDVPFLFLLFLDGPEREPGSMEPRREEGGRVCSRSSLSWTESKSSVASFPAQRRIAWDPPGCESMNSVSTVSRRHVYRERSANR